MVIVYHFVGSVKQYAQAERCPGREWPLPKRCPHPDCQAAHSLVRWGTYWRWACTERDDYHLCLQRVRCKICGRTHSLLPDFLHPYRHYVLSLLQQVIQLYLLVGLGFGRLMTELAEPGPAPSTVREWVRAFAYGAGHLLLEVLSRSLLSLNPEADLPGSFPSHLARSRQADRLVRAYTFWLLAEQLYAQIKARQPWLRFSLDQLLPLLLHWLQQQALPPRLFWSPDRSGTPTVPY